MHSRRNLLAALAVLLATSGVQPSPTSRRPHRRPGPPRSHPPTSACPLRCRRRPTRRRPCPARRSTCQISGRSPSRRPPPRRRPSPCLPSRGHARPHGLPAPLVGPRRRPATRRRRARPRRAMRGLALYTRPAPEGGQAQEGPGEDHGPARLAHDRAGAGDVSALPAGAGSPDAYGRTGVVPQDVRAVIALYRPRGTAGVERTGPLAAEAGGTGDRSAENLEEESTLNADPASLPVRPQSSPYASLTSRPSPCWTVGARPGATRRSTGSSSPLSYGRHIAVGG